MLILACLIFTLLPSNKGFGQGPDSKDTYSGRVPDRYGMAMLIGNTYDPENNITFLQFSGFALLDYQKVWKHRAPEPLRFKIEGSLGTTTRPDRKLMTSINIFALYYLRDFSYKALLPYVEGGIGLIYTDFQVEGQGLRFNFNPQIGVGTEFRIGSMTNCFTAFRLHHISNGGLHHENRGVNSVTFSLGRFF